MDLCKRLDDLVNTPIYDGFEVEVNSVFSDTVGMRHSNTRVDSCRKWSVVSSQVGNYCISEHECIACNTDSCDCEGKYFYFCIDINDDFGTRIGTVRICSVENWASSPAEVTLYTGNDGIRLSVGDRISDHLGISHVKRTR